MAATFQTLPLDTAPAHPQESPSTTAPVREHTCLFTHDLRRKQKRWKDGRLKYHTFNRRVMVYDERGNFIGDTHWREDHELADGDEVELERGGIVVQTGECVGSCDQDLSELVDKRAEEKAKRQAAAAAAAASRRPSTPSVGPLHAVRPQPLPPRHLHDVIGTPSGHHGRAVIPKESPYEERRRAQITPQSEGTRPAKRQRPERSPPRKSGYAQNLFGATLTLSGCPSTQASVRPLFSKITNVHEESTSPPSSGQSSRESHLSHVRQSTHKQIAFGVSSGCPKDPAAWPGHSEPCVKPTPSLHTITGPDPRYPTPVLRKAQMVETGRPRRARLGTETNKENTASSLSHRSFLQRILPGPNEPGTNVEDTVLAERPPLASLDRAGQLKNNNRLRSGYGEKQPRGRGLASSSLVDLTLNQTEEYQQQLVNGEPKTELRIKPRKKRGLLMISEKDAILNSRKPGPGRARPTTATSSAQSLPPPQDPGHTRAYSEAIYETETINIEVETPNPSSPVTKNKHMAKDVGDCCSKNLRPRRRVSDRQTDISDTAEQAHEEPDFGGSEVDSSVDDMPPPRLARLGRKSIRSKEVIGFVFDEGLEVATNTMSSTSCQTDQAAAGETHAPNIAADSCIVAPPARPTSMSGQQSMGPKADKQPTALHRENSETSQTLPETMISESIDISPAGTAIPPKGILVQPITNPATRGRKAAKPSDATGQMPICPLPKEATGNLPMQHGPKRTHARENQEKNTDALPGFSRANGGPWSREAHDLFDFKRPP